MDNSCINNLCYDVCSLGVCGDDADCKIHEHRPVCSCPPGTTGDPSYGCQAVLTEKPVLPSEAIPETTPIYPDDPIRPTAEPASPGLPPLVEHPSPRPTLPPVTQPPPPPTPGPLPVGCETSDECPSDNSCVNRLCLNVCYPGLCGENADCQTQGNRPLCACPPGTTGNPTIKCSAMAVETPPIPYPPEAGQTPGITDSPISPIAGPATTGLPPLSEEAPRPTPGPEIPRPVPPPIIPAIPIACENNDDCDVGGSCINMLCYDVCSLNSCGEDAECKSFNHRPVCLCPPGTTGNPQIGCKATTTEQITVLPITDRPPKQPEITIYPIAGTTSTLPPPVTEYTTPRIPEPSSLRPPPVPTPEPIPVGCESNDHCPYSNTCVNRFCLDMCYPGLCGENANCQTQSHRPVCTCPPGTTGNPTSHCIAIATEMPTTINPLTDKPLLPEDDLIVPGKEPSGTPPPPIVELPTGRPTEPPLPRPRPPPIVPAIAIACVNNDDCSIDNSCINHFCYDVCSLGICGDDADCKIHNHRPVCSCPPGTTGEPTQGCNAVLTERPPTSHSPISEIHPIHPDDQIIPLTEPTRPVLPPLVELPSPKPTEPSVTPPPPPPTPGPTPVGCETTDECPSDNSCINRLCLDVCYPGLCGQNADCQTHGHRPLCTCPPGTTGNPTVKCSALAVDYPQTPPTPLAGETIQQPDLPVTPLTGPKTTRLPPLVEEPTTPYPEPPPPRPTLPPLIPPISTACENNDDCDVDNSCINLLCYDACTLGVCGDDADCRTVNHRPVCLCPPGTTGDPQISCKALVTESSTTLPPDVEVPPHPEESIHPISDAPTRPPPIAETPEPRPPQEFITQHPTPIPTAPPIIVGCESNDQCSFDNTCVNRLCLDVCHPGLCGDNADCQTIGHRPSCVCPPGTTGNPTVHCSAMATERPVTISPITGKPEMPDDKPLIPEAGVTSVPLPPIAETPPPKTPEPPIERPPPTPIVPPVAIACKNNDDCTTDNSCINNLCYDVCSLGVCGEDADCRIHNHRPVCSCPPGTTGDPTTGCRAKLTDRPETPLQPIAETTPIQILTEIRPTAEPASPGLPPLVELPPPRPTLPPVTQPPPPPTPGPLPVGCETSDECPADNSCVNRLCLNVCYPGLCGDNADCQTHGNRPSCTCPPGTTGNPTIKCSAMAFEMPPKPIPPEAGKNPEMPDYPITPISSPVITTILPPIVETIRPSTQPPIQLPPPTPIVPAIPIACENNDDCDMDNSCINKLCYDACTLGICGEDAQCRSVNHRPICLCPYGTTGDPQVECKAVTTERPITVSPIAESPQVSDPPIQAIPGPQPTPPSPIAESPPPRPTEPPIVHPPAVPTAPPNPVGCESTDECPYDNSCINRLCLDVCHPGLCGESADCQTIGHRPLCVCPPGTTGNPTESCKALATDKPTTISPMTGIPEVTPGQPIVPGVGTSTPTLPPLAEMPTPRPPLPTTPRPPPAPLVPPFVIACTNNDDCTMDNSCINNLCYDVCSLGVCGDDADCKIHNHRPVCSCPPGTTGDPSYGCQAMLTERPVTPPAPISGSTPTQGYPPIIPTAEPASPGLPPLVEHTPSRPTLPPVTQPPPPPTPGPLPVGCETSDECPSDNSCVNRLCLNVCYPGLCGDNADCQTHGNRPSCTCPPGTTGNPTIKCSAMAVETPPIPYPPEAGQTPGITDSPISPIAGTAPPGLPPLSEEAPRPTPGPEIPRPPPLPIVPAIPIACENNDDCDVDNSCLNKLCYDACTLGICGDDADCTTVNHRPVCLCPYGTTGDPQVGCKAITTERPVTVPPVAELPQVSDPPIHAIPGPQPTPPSPIAESPPPRPTEPPIVRPPAVPTAPPNPVGCESTDECPYDNSCINRLCLNVCHPGLCGESADCQTIGHRPLCVCPPGTTGNPTESCKALATDKPTTISPVTGIPQVTPGQPIVPGVGTSTPTLPPLAETPTPRPPLPTTPRPPPAPLVPPFVIACTNNDDCTMDNSCINNLCYDVCSLGVCGDDADCKIHNHRPVCSCPPGTTGDPSYGCQAMLTERPVTPPAPISGSTPTQGYPPIIPTAEPASPGLPPLVEHTPSRPTLPPVTQPPPPPTPGPLPVGCETSDECPSDNSCVNRLCLNVCYPGLCGDNADCQTHGNRPSCTCPPGTTGNPTIKCSAMAVETPPIPYPPEAGQTPGITDSPISPIAGTAPPGLPPLSEEAPRPTPGPEIPRPPPLPIVPAIPIACKNNDDCDVDNSCLNKLCYDACTLGICGDDADCTTVNHRPVCLCPYGTTGDPQVGCKAITTERPVTVPPVAELPQVSDPPIHAIPGPQPTPPSPIAESPPPRPTEPPIVRPPAVPTAPPNPVGCESTDECPYDNSCINRLCLNVCHPGLCGESADCQTIGHRPLCVCPPGTTGNPTESCKALATDKPTTILPVTGIPEVTPGQPIVPGVGTSTPTLPPLAETPTPRPPLPTTPRPPPAPLVPPFVIACTNNDDCTMDNSCINNLCYDVCSLGVCGDDADCKIHNHRPVCSCPPGTTGDPSYGCQAMLTERPVTPPAPISGSTPTQGYPPIIPTAEPASPGLPPLVEHTPTRPTLPPVTQPPPPPTPGPLPVGCETSDECPSDNSCVNRLCLNVCYPGLCGDNADCQTHGNRPSCTCPPGTTGNPTIKCSAMAVETPPIPYPPEAGQTPGITDSPISPIAGTAPPGLPPLSEEAPRPTPGPEIPRPPPLPIVPAIPIACENNDDCDVDNSCLNKLCYGACSLGICGQDADCQTSNHRPVCICPPGTTGDPQIRCHSITPYEPVVPSPVAGTVQHPVDPPIRPIASPSTAVPPPLVSESPTRPTDPPVPEPPVVPTPPPVPTGCESNDECPYDNTCVNRLCFNVCFPGLCGNNADCQTQGHRPACVCPPGTTGNPTVHCSAIIVESPDTPPPPIAASSSPRPDEPIVPGAGQTSRPPPPLVEEPTTRPPEPPIPPPSQPILPPVVIACTNNDECPMDNSCLNHICYDACGLGICGDDADCKIHNHRPVCSCPPGTTGSPTIGCQALTAEQTTVSTPIKEMASPPPDIPIVPVSPPPSTTQAPIGEDPTRRPIPTTTPRPPAPPTPPPVPVGCESTDECPYDNSCVNKLCLDVCHPGLCGENADCQTQHHRPVCACPPGTTGNPTLKCSAIAILEHPDPPTPIGEDQTPPPDQPIVPVSPPPSTIPPPESEVSPPRPTEKPLPTPPPPPIVPPIQIACENNDDCEMDNSCINMLCYDVCSLGICGENADCKTLNHRPVCVCPPGTTGNPQSHCSAMLIDSPSTPAPPVAETTKPHITPIKPSAGTSTAPPPLSETQPPREKDPVIVRPPAPVTEGPLPIGCARSGQCAFDEKCVNRLCVKVCSLGPCDTSSECYAQSHEAVCKPITPIAARPQCVVDPDCFTTQVCIDNVCRDVCLTSNPCAPMAVCSAQNHRPQCNCPPGYIGNPFVSCRRPEQPTPPPVIIPQTTPRPDCIVDNDCPYHLACLNQECKNPCLYRDVCGVNAECVVTVHTPMCVCTPGYTGNPYVLCSPPSTPAPTPAPPVIQPQCTVNEDCLDHQACFSGNCQNPCLVANPCAPTALCDVSRHRPVCSCPSGLTGDPYLQCTMIVEPPPKPECRVNDDCSDALACVEQQCKNPCALYDNCAPNAECHVTRHRPVCSCPDGFVGNPNIQCLVAGCRSNSDCPVLQACVNQECEDPCDFENCGTNAECRVVNHRAQCYCPESFLGDPYVRCERPECVVDEECPTWLACIRQECEDPCNCGPNAECRVINHRPQCLCPPGYEGDAYVECTRPPISQPSYKECQTDGDCPSKLACFDGRCDDPCLVVKPCGINAKCQVIDTLPYRTMTCECLPGFLGNAYVECSPRPTEPPGCTTDDECGPSEICRNRQCLDPCAILNPCAPNAECQVLNRRPQCTCPPGYTGNPNVNCYQTTPRPPRKCEIDIDCFNIDKCLDSRCQNPCFAADPCPQTSVCKPYKHQPYCICPEGTSGDPYVACNPVPPLEPACRLDTDCPSDEACINQLCVDPCLVEDPCGRNALCRTQQHRPVCSCPDGWAGDPRIECFQPDCIVNEDCPTDKACVNQNCVDPCTYSGFACGLNAECRAVLHRAQCYCPAGMQGNPTVACVAVGCISNDDCADDKACDRLNRVCVPVCESTTCAVQAECRAANHAAMCVCPPRHQGNPYLQCLPVREPPVTEALPEPECRRDPDCPSLHACINEVCRNPCLLADPCVPSQECRVVDGVPLRTMVCECPPNQILIKDGVCVPIGVVEPQCTIDQDCADHERCRDGTCVNVCRPDPCGLNAQCMGENHAPRCQCAPGYFGDPFVQCRRIIDTELPPPQCTTNDQCGDSESCVNQRCVNPCILDDPCAQHAFCYVREHRPVCRCPEGFIGDPEIECRPPTVPIPSTNWTTGGSGKACGTHRDCGPDQWCQSGRCQHPCPSACPPSAECQVHDQRPVCSCPSSTTGRPQEQCHPFGCETDGDCPYYEKCYRGTCQNPCHAGRPCAPTATCTPTNHQALCTCPPGYTGSPTDSCVPIGCTSSRECPTDQACYRGSCVNPCVLNTPCGPGTSCLASEHSAKCTCRPGLLGDPHVSCALPGPKPDTPQCRSDFDCVANMGCVDGTCIDLCAYLKPCGEDALCRTIDMTNLRTVTCECPPGHAGNAYVKCQKVEEQPKCQYDADCPFFQACISTKCRDPCETSPCAAGAECRAVNHRAICYCPADYTGDGYTSCSRLECTLDTSCPEDSVCFNGKCTGACSLSRPCGTNAKCQASRHRSECQCLPGYTGDPYLSCSDVQCTGDDSCPSTHVCYDGKCVDPCQIGSPCQSSQECKSVGHKPICTCPAGFTQQANACVPEGPRCSYDSECRSGEACLDGKCTDLCRDNPCGLQATCTVRDGRPLATVLCQCGPGFTGDPFRECVAVPVPPSGCSTEYDCPWAETCEGGRCVDPCKNTQCAPGAICRALGHRGVCSCAPGFQGDPNVLCTTVGCTQRTDCPVKEACVNGRCVDPCKEQNPCGTDAKCEVTQQGPVCTCVDGYDGDPYVECQPLGCQTNSQCPVSQECREGECMDPCNLQQCVANSECVVENHKAKCRCLKGFTGDPDRFCSLPPVAECQTDTECPALQGCIDGKCQDLCQVIHPCGTSALCKVIDNRPMRAMSCSCPEGYDGDPYYACTKVSVTSKESCTSDLDCPLRLSCEGGKCRNPCPAGCGTNATCSAINHRPICHCQPGYAGVPEEGCYKIDCESDNNCPATEMCKQNICVDPCEKDNPCPPSAKCYAANHRAQCQCPPGTSGNPQVSCQLVECTANQDCKSFEACVNGECKDPCAYYNPCAASATCRVVNHEHQCACPPGLQGDARLRCEPPTDPQGCFVDQDCPPTHGCILSSLVTRYHNKVSAVYLRFDDKDSGSTCRDLCEEHQPCGFNAICSVIDSKPRRSMSCACPPGFHGDAKIECRKIPSQGGCIRDTDCLFSEACIEGLCRDPCNCGLNAQCHVANHRPYCTCPHVHAGDPNVACYRTECVSDVDCPSDKACIENECVDPCTAENTRCAPTALCTVEEHKPQCSCSPGERGDAKIQCLAIACRGDSECPHNLACENDQCVDPCEERKCGVGAVCTVQGHVRSCECLEGHYGDPEVACRPQSWACVVDHDCGVGLVCMRGECADPCKRERPCATNAMCTVQETRPIKSVTCTCPAGFTGDAEVQCRKITPRPQPPCLRDNDCPDTLACLRGQCLDPCSCGENAVCRVTNHHPVCSCAAGYRGDPYTACYATGCRTDSECQDTEKCYNGECINPCYINNPCSLRAECFAATHEAKCRCPAGMEGDPYVKCEAQRCRADTDCTSDRACRDGYCVEVCLYTRCAPDATCRAENHRGTCVCPPGLRGDPTFRCADEESREETCTKDQDCAIGKACIDDECQDLCGTQTCGENARCRVVESVPFRSSVCECLPGYKGDAHTQCRRIPGEEGVCSRDNDCAGELACVEGLCRDPCDCGVNALCTVVDHRPICTCSPGYEGNPQTACVATGCTSNSECADDRMCYQGNCVSPCLVANPCAPRAECQAIAHEARCFCPSGTRGDPLTKCLVVGCRANSDCPPDRMCLNNVCLDPCVHNNTCAPNAQCRGVNHAVECRCPPGSEGVPSLACNEKQQECRSDYDCQSGYGCMGGQCKRPCEELTPCPDPTVCQLVDTRPLRTMTCTCPEHMVVSEKGLCVDLDLPISVGCRADSECPGDQACLNTQCVTPCDCGHNAECRVLNHRPVCTCQPGYQGNPNIGCFKVGCSVNEECPLDKMCSNNVCVNPCLVNDPCDVSAECYPEQHVAKCRCPPGLEGDPFIRCELLGCRSNSECPTDKACINRQCVNPCLYNNECAPNAECYVFQHIAGCRCPKEMPYGDPRFNCEDKSVIVDDPKPECRVDADCPSQRACIDERCVNPCHILNPCDETARCEVVDSVPVRTMICICVDGFVMTEEGSCKLVEKEIIPGCAADSECPPEEACINRMCRSPCDCGRNAICEIINHRPVCTCQVGFQGNPDIGCFPVGCQQDSDCEDDQACYDGVCANPCLVDDPCARNAECYAERHRAQCRCPSGLQGDGYTECLVIGCRSNSDCPSDRGCINTQCVDPCIYQDPCARTAECVNLDHEARCRCPPGTTGDPRIQCLPIPEPECRVDGDCPSQHACIDERCQNPCVVLDPCDDSAECRVIDTLPVRTMICICPDGLIIEQGGSCRRVPQIQPGCAADPECPSDKACFNGFCRDPCICGPNAICDIVEHHPVCSCKRGYEGDPEIRCDEIGCYSNDDCPTTHACRNGQCAPVCGPDNEPCGEEAICQGVSHEAVCYCPPGSRGNPRTQCIAIGCASNDACPDDRSCINQRCVSPCSLDPCEEPATCRVADHVPECPCPPGFNGTRDKGCEKIVIGCRNDGDCPSKTACINAECVDLCGLDPCGENTECRVVDTVPIRTAACECLPGYQGDALDKCIPTPVCPFEKGFILGEDDRCVCPAERGFYVDENGNCARCPVEVGFVLTEDGMCICDPEKGYVLTRAGTCDCPLPAYKDEDGNCVVTTDPPPILGCTSNSECPTDKACVNRACVPPCGFDPCAKYATCVNNNHTAICNCISGYSGDPYQEDGCRTFARTDVFQPDMLVNCLADGVQVDIKVGDPGFDGVMYVKGYSKNEECRRVVKPDVDVGTIDFKVKFNTCGLIHENGLARFILVLQKHPKLVTYKAQAYHVKCTYNTGEKTITIGFNVSMLTTAGTIANTGPPPKCIMQITDQNGGNIQGAEIGDLLMLRIQVDPPNIYGGFARSCVALTANSDGDDNEYTVTDENGCATDPAIFGEWEQEDGEGKTLVALFNAFKFPSSNSIRFQCNVRVCFGRCQPVNCNGYDAFGKRRRRNALESDAEILYPDERTYDGQLREITVSSQAIITIENRADRLTAPENPEGVGVEEVCVNKWGFIIALIITALLALVAVAVAVSCWLMAYRRKPKHAGPLPHPPEFPNPLFTTPEPLAEPSPDYFS